MYSLKLLFEFYFNKTIKKKKDFQTFLNSVKWNKCVNCNNLKLSYAQ